MAEMLDPPLREPAKRHQLSQVNQKTMAKRLNTVIEPSVDISNDVSAINAGRATRQGNNFIINGRTYGTHDGILFPISGVGFHQLDRGAFKALGVYNQFGDTSRATEILDNMAISSEQRQAALRAWRAGRGGTS